MNNEKNMTFADLYTADYELTDIYAERQTWYDGTLFKRERPRKSNGLIFLNGCCGEYINIYGRKFTAPCRSFVCLPYGSKYSVMNISSKTNSPDAYLVEFNIVINDKKCIISDSPFSINNVNPFYVKEILKSIVEEYEVLVKSPSVLKQLIYKLIAYIGKEELMLYNKKYSEISAAVDFVEKNPTTSLSVERLANMCHMSVGCFRKLFGEYSGKSPIRYMTERKTDMAKKMLEESNTSVERIAELLEFKSSSYFCKFFKKNTGMTPGEYRKLY